MALHRVVDDAARHFVDRELPARIGRRGQDRSIVTTAPATGLFARRIDDVPCTVVNARRPAASASLLHAAADKQQTASAPTSRLVRSGFIGEPASPRGSRALLCPPPPDRAARPARPTAKTRSTRSATRRSSSSTRSPTAPRAWCSPKSSTSTPAAASRTGPPSPCSTRPKRAGLLKPGGTIVEATSGNTGAGLAMAAAIRGYRCILVMPDKMSKEKIDLLRAYGAEVVVTPTNVAPDSPESYYGVANRLAVGDSRRVSTQSVSQSLQSRRALPYDRARRSGSRRAERSRISSRASAPAARSPAPRAILKEQNPTIHVVGADPEGSIYSGDMPRSYAVEGIGMNYLPETVDLNVIDEMVRVSDRESFLMARRIAREEGLARRRLVGHGRRRRGQARQDAAERRDRRRDLPGFGPRLHVEDLQRRVDDRQRLSSPKASAKRPSATCCAARRRCRR